MDAFKEEKKILQQLEKTRDVIRRKHMLLKQGQASMEKTLGKTFKPIVDPLEKLVNIAKTKSNHTIKHENLNDVNNASIWNEQSDSDSQSSDDTVMNMSAFETADEEEEDDNVNGNKETIEKKYLTMLKNNNKQYLDNLYGVKLSGSDKNKFTIGNSPIVFTKDSVVVNGTNFSKTNGLLELLFKKNPDSKIYNMNDKINYRDILEISSAHKKNYNKNEALKSFRSNKFYYIIAPLFDFSTKKSKKDKIGKGFLPPYKVASKGREMDYVYWDDPNELVDRLKLLMAEVAAGNSSHVNEIQSIIEELREGGYIY